MGLFTTLTITIALTSTTIIQTGGCTSRPQIAPTPTPTPSDDKKCNPRLILLQTPELETKTALEERQNKAARTIQKFQRKQRILRCISQECHQILNSETVKAAAGTRYEFEGLVAEMLYQQTLEDFGASWSDSTKHKPGLPENFAGYAEICQHEHIKAKWSHPTKQQFTKFLCNPGNNISGRYMVLARLDCVDLLHAYCALHRANNQIERNNSEVILNKLYAYGLPKPISNSSHK